MNPVVHNLKGDFSDACISKYAYVKARD